MSGSESSQTLSSATSQIEDTIRALLASETPEQRERRHRRCDEYEAERRARSLGARRSLSGVPLAYRDADVSEVPELRGVDLTSSMLLLGQQGRGKTHAACAILNARSADCVTRFSTFDQVLKEVQATFGGKGSANDVLAKYRNCACLVIDDFGKERPTDYSVGQFFALLNWRINNAKQTILTSNYTLATLMDRLGQCGEDETVAAVMSRLCCRDVGRGGFLRIVFGEPDRRLGDVR